MAEDLATTVNCRTSDSDLYAALMLSDLLDNKEEEQQQLQQQQQPREEPIPKAPDTPPSEEEQEEEEDFTNVIWVPADKHPQIAPTEFAKFIQSQGTSIPIRRANSLHRQKSILSQSQTSQDDEDVDFNKEEEEDLKRTLSEKKRAFLKRISIENERLALDSKTHIFDRNSTAYDDSRIIAPRTDRSLLRRSAFSARGRGRKSNVESSSSSSSGSKMDHENNNNNNNNSTKTKRRSRRRSNNHDNNNSNNNLATTTVAIATNDDNSKSIPWDKSEGVVLYDQPVNMSEWIDLGSASLESDDSQRGILSRVHDAESQLRSQINQDEVDNNDNNNEVIVKKNSDTATATTVKEEEELNKKEKEMNKNDDNEKTLSNIPPPLPTQQQQVTVQDGPKRPTIKRTLETVSAPVITTIKQEKRSSWLTNLFQPDHNKKSTKKNSGHGGTTSTTPTSNAIQMVSNTTTNGSPLSSLATLFTKSLSIRSNSTISSSNGNNSTASPSPLSILQQQEEATTKKKRSSRLEIPPPSQRTFFNTNRLPLHVERAIYRLSHIKLANPRRPLCQQVLISNLMFWYLSIQQNDHHLIQQQQQQQQQQYMIGDNNSNERLLIESPTASTTTTMFNQKKSGSGSSKMSRLIHSAKKKRGEVVQLVQSYPIQNYSPSFSSTTTSSSSSSIKSSSSSPSSPSPKHNVQFSLPAIPTHTPIMTDSLEDEEDNVPLSHFKN